MEILKYLSSLPASLLDIDEKFQIQTKIKAMKYLNNMLHQ